MPGKIYDSYEAHREELELIRADPTCDAPLRALVAIALNTPLFSLREELALYEQLEQRENIQARERLIEVFQSFAITKAWACRHLEVLLLDLVAAAQHRLCVAAYSFRPAGQKKTFYSVANEALTQGIVEKLEDEGIGQVNPFELQRLLRNEVVRKLRHRQNSGT